MRISDNTIFIPGATSGIGLALALRFQAAGNTVIVGGRRTELLERIRAEHPGIDAVAIDTADPASIRAAADEVLRRHPDLGVIVTMAGIMRPEAWADPEGFLETAERTVETNLLGTIRLIAAFLPHLRARGEGTIMTVSSGLAFAPLAATPTYNATKAAVHMLSESIRLQLAGTGVEVVELAPPAVQTDLMPGHAENPTAMPLEAFCDEVMALIAADPHATEILVERVKFLRYGEARGDYADVVRALNGA
ncbi:SDR family oxidoreductase [Microbacterium excoecariae]|uniref:SDR family oxidoreductase n=1 Tax=Microbacterium excoecariae TaxID=2715210 RepID=UPI00140C2DF0|nr:SDR family NAD(P)-dependent oxidoreductase [Microbacterium excoecariae]NHI15638.1 SDR family NAD(P)-dependent oxidoreductase [Microbacterium excoecariae]